MDATGACGGTCRRRWGLWLGLGVVGLAIGGFVACAVLDIGWRQTTVAAHRSGADVIVRITRTMIPGPLAGHARGAYELAEAIDPAGVTYKSEATQVAAEDWVIYSRHEVEFSLRGVPDGVSALSVRARLPGHDGAIPVARDVLPILPAR